jgi:hypothetical protein
MMAAEGTSMTKKLLFVGLMLLAVAAVVIAADAITGKWVYETQGRDGTPRQTTLDLKADGATLTGTVTQPFGGRGGGGGGAAPAPQATPISNGKVSGNNVSFEVTREFGGNSMTTKYEGTVSGNEMKLKVTMPGFGGGEPRVTDATAKKQ